MKLSICLTMDSVLFTPGVIDGSVSLGGSESSAVGLCRALAARGHDVHIFVSQLDPDAPDVDHAGVWWHHSSQMGPWSILKAWDVAIALRMPLALTQIPAKFRVLWSEDLMYGESMKLHTMSCAWAFDAVAYVSQYHRAQWEGIVPEVAQIGWVTKNGYDPALVPTGVTKDPTRMLYISRPERGLTPILAMWPALRARAPHATLQICRYSSMYDAGGWGKVCAEYDRAVEAVQAKVGGITWLGELGKPALYLAIAEAAVMWYPGVVDFGETSCVAAIEAQACGTPFVGSWKGALPETVPSGVLIPGDAVADPDYQAASIAAVLEMLDGCARQSFVYRQRQQAGRAHVRAYTYAAIAAEWETWLLEQFRTRYEAAKPKVLARLLHEDDHVMARVVASELADADAVAFCDYVIAGKDHTATDYGEHALDPIAEMDTDRVRHVVAALEGRQTVLDVACGPGAFALALAQADPTRTVVGVDFSPRNIERATAAAEALGLADRVTFHCASVWDFDRQAPVWLATAPARTFDGVFCGEFLEHVAEAHGLLAAIDGVAAPGAQIVLTVPFGPLGELVPRWMPLHRGHVHHFQPADLRALFGHRDGFKATVMPGGLTPTGAMTGNWLIRYQQDGQPPGQRPIARRLLVRPKATIAAAVLVGPTALSDVRACLEEVWPVVDEVLLGDCSGQPEAIAAIARDFPRKTRIVSIGPVPDLPEGFSDARNRLLKAATADWYFWIDADEKLCGALDLAKYLDGSVFHGYVVPQNHLHLDQPMTTDTPVRVFRRSEAIRFYGVVHEQPQMGHVNGEIQPCLQLSDVQIAHTGYLFEGVRRQKGLGRNLPLLIRDRERFPDRELGRLLWMREHATLAMVSMEAAGGQLTESAKAHYQQVVGIFEAHFADPGHKFHGLGRPFYESALRHVAGALEVEVAIAGREGGLNGSKAKPTRVWVRKPEDIRVIVNAKITDLLKPVEQPVLLAVEPVVPRQAVAV